MEPLRVETCDDERRYRTFREALDAARDSARSLLAQETTASLEGTVLVAATFTDVSLSLTFAGRGSLRFCLEDGIVTWSTGREAISRRKPLAAPELFLQFPGDRPPFLWRRQFLVERLVNRGFRSLSASHAWAFLSIADNPTLMLMRVAVTGEGRDILFFDPV